jgi:hypothetical protein
MIIFDFFYAPPNNKCYKCLVSSLRKLIETGNVEKPQRSKEKSQTIFKQA